MSSSPPTVITDLSQRFLNSARMSPDFTCLDELCRLSFQQTPQANYATKAIFSIIEYLCDDFSDFGISLSSEVLARIVQFIRATPEGSAFDTLLNSVGLTSSQILLERFQRQYTKPPLSTAEKEQVKKILILSRVTAGADIAITGVIVKRLSESFPEAELVLIGPSHLQEMFGKVANTKCLNFIYKNDGTLFEKMTSWPTLLGIAQNESQEYRPGEVLLFDPDSRLTQLGLLPLIDDNCTFVFPSRACQPQALRDKNLSYLANQWLNRILNEKKTLYPKISFIADKASSYSKFYSALKSSGCKFIVTINFGVGNNPAKKLSSHFEEALLEKLLQTPDTAVLLDSGRGSNETTRVKFLVRTFGQKEISTAQITAKTIEAVPKGFRHGLITFKGPLGALGKMIDATDCFIGYDSCGQHLANATRTPAVILFAGAPTPRFIQRWAPTNKENITIPVQTDSNHLDIDHTSLLDEVMEAVNTIRSRTLATN